MLEFLERYQVKGEFSLGLNENLNDQCNAPRKWSGIYLVFAKKIQLNHLIYIGISGRKGPNGKIIHRSDGIGGRIVKGKQFGEARRNSWQKQMRLAGFDRIYIKWYVTHGEVDIDFPREIEHDLLTKFHEASGQLPLWNKSF
ncbi:hypothetical protein [Roseivirga spongicola]|uniref:GIY-YIG domain-containing protein n=1 Tax=Roseivirga spongicola TaxID=333140 RepID=A0A150X1S8_9BACT|nr:hypothetical protein [Roseivirga spongicola]KYG72658.1 hypothetical protein AWW68_17330 [Roseivirga spongicola]WPZ10260.1 hypothetical protein T7867_18510 [Roseivirga spongicola]